MFVLTSMIVTVAPGIVSPAESVTVPNSVPVTACARAGDAENAAPNDATSNASQIVAAVRNNDTIASSSVLAEEQHSHSRRGAAAETSPASLRSLRGERRERAAHV